MQPGEKWVPADGIDGRVARRAARAAVSLKRKRVEDHAILGIQSEPCLLACLLVEGMQQSATQHKDGAEDDRSRKDHARGWHRSHKE